MSDSPDSAAARLIVLAVLAFSLLLGIAAMGVARASRRRPASSAQSRGWHEQCVRWGVVPPGNRGSEVERVTLQVWRYGQSWALTGMGCGLIAGAVLGAGLSLVTTGNLLAVTAPNLFPGVVLLTVTVGAGIGTVLGLMHLRQASVAGEIYADAQPRTLSRYRSLRIPTFLGAIVLVDVAATLYLGPHVHSHLFLHLATGGRLVLPASRSVLGTIPALLTLVLALEELLTLWVVRLPRLVNAGDPIISRRVDDMLRLSVVWQVQSGTLLIFFFLSSAQWTLLGSGLAPGRFPLYDWGSWVVLVIIGVVMVGLSLVRTLWLTRPPVPA